MAEKESEQERMSRKLEDDDVEGHVMKGRK